jgi:23S rRNA (cytosine1962-C5)-methyltransferase
MNQAKLILKHGRDKSLLRRHPWVFSGAIDHIKGEPEAGAVVDILSSEGSFLARAAYSPQSQIRARVWSWNQDDAIDKGFLKARLQSAITAHKPLLASGETDALRLAHAESDELPGLVVDKYEDVVVVQFLSWGAEAWREALIELLQELTGASAIYERSDAAVRELEGLEPAAGLLAGKLTAGGVRIQEHGLAFQVDIEHGHKTGFYLDQRDNRLLVRELAEGREVLDCFSYSGGFALNALKGGAKSVAAIDSSVAALDLLKQNLALNDFSADDVELVEADVFARLRLLRDQNRKFDLIVLDPPKFAPTRAQADRAARAYKDINLLAFKLLRPGGLLATFSCSGGVDRELFQKIVAGAALDANADARIVKRLGQAGDHPVALNFPEGEYLKGLVCKIK